MFWGVGGAVGKSADLTRIRALPRRSPTPDPAVTADYAARLKTPAGTMTLRPLQAMALRDAFECRGLVAALGVGEGKGLLGLLLPTVLEARVTVLLVPAALRYQMCDVMYPAYAPHWRLPFLAPDAEPVTDAHPEGVVHVVSYSMLSSIRFQDVLARLKPDCIVCDEAHSVADYGAARTKRFRTYVRGARSSGVLQSLCLMSGTILSKSITDVAPLAGLALGSASPWPLDWNTLQEWAGALDPGGFPANPGALTCFRVTPTQSVLEGFRDRVTHTPGVVVSQGNTLATSLVIGTRAVRVPKAVSAVLAAARETWCMPDGTNIDDALTFSRHVLELACGFYYRRTWPRGESLETQRVWLDSRSAWYREVSNYLSQSARAGCDSLALCEQSAARGDLGWTNYVTWAQVRDTAKPDREAVWFSEFLLEDAVRWGAISPGIIWYEHDAVGRKIAELGGHPLYDGGSVQDQEIAKETGSRTIVASVNAHGTGKNLQIHSRSLITSATPSGKVWEQLIGRTHREGQQADAVSVAVYLHTPELVSVFERARVNARFIQDALGAWQRLCYASYADGH